jgi:hypothetical protein
MDGCASTASPRSVAVQCHIWQSQQQEMYGPEDLVIDTSQGRARLIISSLRRGILSKGPGELFEMDLRTHQIEPLKRNLPQHVDQWQLLPHGIDVRQINSTAYLYVVVHADEQVTRQNSVVRYRISSSGLVFDDDYGVQEHQLLTHPNDVQAEDGGGFFATNLSRSASDVIISWHPGKVVHFSGGRWQALENQLGNWNGLYLNGHELLAADDKTNQIVRFSLTQEDDIRPVLALPYPDNINRGPGQDLFIASHDSIWKFILHSMFHSLRSSGSIYHVHLDQSHPIAHKLFITDGRSISAPSTAVWFDGKLYIGQVYNSYILEVPAEDLERTYVCN